VNNLKKDKLVELVINISEGCNTNLIKNIVKHTEKFGAVCLHIDSNCDAGRSVLTFIANPSCVLDTVFQLYKVCLPQIDMNKRHGVHPCIGAVDVCPVVPLYNISIDECVALSKNLAEKISKELLIPCYLYNASAPKPVTLHELRKYGFLGLNQMLQERKPNYGNLVAHPTFGATIIGAREILIAYNVTLDTSDLEIAKKIARNIRKLSGVKAIGWYIEEYKKVQVSCNIENFKKLAMEDLYLAVTSQAKSYGVKPYGSELIGLTPLQGLSKVFAQSHVSTDLIELKNSKLAILDIVNKINLEVHSPFVIEDRIIEYCVSKYLSLMNLSKFII
jgi:glutamate formiminotransferase / 5-formyltetrahydrofolate cyclo-ligase